MMKKKFALKQTLFVAMLAVAGLFGVSATLINNQVKETPVVKKADAAYDPKLHIVGKGTFGNWDVSHAVQMVSDGTSNTAKKTGITISANTEFKIAYIDNGAIQWGWDSYGSGAMDNKAYTFAEDSSGNIKIKYDGKYNIYLTNSYKVYMSRDITITFNPNSGTVSPTSKTVTQEYSGATGNTYGDLPTPTRDNYTFDGWYTSSSGGTEVTSSSSTYSLTANQTLYAHWTINPLVTKYEVVDGGSPTSIGSEYVIPGTNYPVPAKIYKEYCTFDGWFTNEACTNAYTARNINSNISLYAKYTNHGAWTGTVNVDLWQSGWADQTAKYAIMFMDKTTYGSEVDGWSNFVTNITAGTRLITFTYSLPFEPLLMTIGRFNTSATEPDWTKKWNQTLDISFATMVRIGNTKDGDQKNYSYSGYPNVMGGTGDNWNYKGHLESVKLNGSNNAEYYGDVTLVQWEKFNIQKAPYDSGDYSGSWSAHSSIAANFQDGGSGSIQAKVAGTYSVYFDSYVNSVYITTVAISQADEWAAYFLANVGCDSRGINVPTGWSDCATEYSKLSGDAKNIVYNATGNPDPSAAVVSQAVARYDQALRSHPSLTKFIVNSGGTPRTQKAISSFSPFELITGSDSSISATTILIIVASSISLLSITALSALVIKKKKEKQD